MEIPYIQQTVFIPNMNFNDVYELIGYNGENIKKLYRMVGGYIHIYQDYYIPGKFTVEALSRRCVLEGIKRLRQECGVLLLRKNRKNKKNVKKQIKKKKEKKRVPMNIYNLLDEDEIESKKQRIHSPIKKSVDYVYETPKENVYETPKEHVYETPKEHVYETPKEHVYETPKEYVYETPIEYVYEKPKEYVYETPKEHVYETPKKQVDKKTNIESLKNELENVDELMWTQSWLEIIENYYKLGIENGGTSLIVRLGLVPKLCE